MKARKRVFKKFTYRGVDLDKLLDMSNQEVLELLPARIRRRFSRGLTRKHTTLLKKLRKAVSSVLSYLIYPILSSLRAMLGE